MWLIRWDGPGGTAYIAKSGTKQDRIRRRKGHVRSIVFSTVGTALAPFTGGISQSVMAGVNAAIETIKDLRKFGLFYLVSDPKEANWYYMREEAESDAVLLVAKDPSTLIGKTSVREWNGKAKKP